MKIVSEQMNHLNGGWGNGYVLIPKSHALHGITDLPVKVLGGLTFFSLVTPELAAHWNLDAQDIGAWAIGFDTNRPRQRDWGKEQVEREAAYLLAQLKQL